VSNHRHGVSCGRTWGKGEKLAGLEDRKEESGHYQVGRFVRHPKNEFVNESQKYDNQKGVESRTVINNTGRHQQKKQRR
jgi:hypothetical protein